MSVFVFPLGAESVSYSPLAHIYKPCWPSKLDILGAYLPGAGGPKLGDPDVRLRLLTAWREPVQL